MDTPFEKTQIGLDGKRHPIGDPALHVHPNRPHAKAPVVFDPAADTGRPLGPGEMADPRVSPSEIADVASGMPIPDATDTGPPLAAPAVQVAAGQYDPRLYPAATTAAEAQMIQDARDSAAAEPAEVHDEPTEDAPAEADAPVSEPESDEPDEAALAALEQAVGQAVDQAVAEVQSKADVEVEAANTAKAAAEAEAAELRERVAELEAQAQASQPADAEAATEPATEQGPDLSKMSGPQLEKFAGELDPPVKLSGSVAAKREQLAAELKNRAEGATETA